MAEQQQSGSSWDDYVKYLMQEGKIETCFILGKDKGDVWAQCSNYKCLTSPYVVEIESEDDPEVKEQVEYCERDALIDGFKNGGFTSIKGGFRIDNIKYYSVKLDSDRQVWYLKKGNGGACVAFTSRVILIGTYNTQNKDSSGKFQNPGDCNKVIEEMAAHLLAQGY